VTPTVSYGLAEGAWEDFAALLDELTEMPTTVRVCELGAGAQPAVSLDAVRTRGLDYTLVDISEEELARAPAGYEKLRADVAAPAPPLDRGHDLAVSRFLAEHVADPAIFHRNVHDLLADGGRALHFFSTLYAPVFALNRVAPERLSTWVVRKLQPARARERGDEKWRAYYRWCRGPTSRQLRRFEELGYEVELYRGFFGTGGYFESLPALGRIDDRLAATMVAHPWPQLTSYALVLLRKIPVGSAGGAS
jgi:SAM-dependent methyltransferase